MDKRMRRKTANAAVPSETPTPSALPEKSNPQSALMSDSPISPTNLDDYLFLDDVLYFDLRSPAQLLRKALSPGLSTFRFTAYWLIISARTTSYIG